MNLSSVKRDGGQFLVTFEDGDERTSQSFDDYGNDTFSVFRFVLKMRKACNELTGSNLELSDTKLTPSEVELIEQFKRDTGIA